MDTEFRNIMRAEFNALDEWALEQRAINAWIDNQVALLVTYVAGSA